VKRLEAGGARRTGEPPSKKEHPGRIIGGNEKGVDIYIEHRKFRRFKFETAILHDLLTHPDVYDGKIANFSKDGLYFESNQTIHPGEEILVKLKKPPDAAGEEGLPVLPFLVKIVWHRRLTAASFGFGYGARYLDPEDGIVKNLEPAADSKAARMKSRVRNTEDPRQYPRRSYNKPLVFDYRNQYYRSLVTDISPGGAFVKSKLRTALGRKITMVIPGSKIRKKSKIKGWIVRRNLDGFGVKFDRKVRAGSADAAQPPRFFRST
jgi:hypothetical protein